MLLNFGHTVGHAIESASHYELRHGECISLGMIAAANISRRLGLLKDEDVAVMEKALAAFNLPTRLPTALKPADIEKLLAQDKKIRGDMVNFVVLDRMGHSEIRPDVPRTWLRAALLEFGHRQREPS